MRIALAIPEAVIVVGVVLACTACAGIIKPLAAPTSYTSRSTIAVPVLSPLDPARTNQEKDGVRIIITPVPFAVARRCEVSYQAGAIPIVVMGDAFPVNRKEVYTPALSHSQLSFNVAVYNRLPRVLRLAGAAISLQISGRTISVPQSRFTEFLNGLIVPQQQADFVLNGPDLSDLVAPNLGKLPGDSATIAFLIYDVVTASDAAGTPTRRANFEFFFRFQLEQHSDSSSTVITPMTVTRAWRDGIAKAAGGAQAGYVPMPAMSAGGTCTHG